jgi:hypothetical protein
MTATTISVSTLAAGAVMGAFERAIPVGNTKKGRVVVEMRGERIGAEAEWFTMCGVLALVRFVKVSGISEIF